jgi:hypothetical protein
MATEIQPIDNHPDFHQDVTIPTLRFRFFLTMSPKMTSRTQLFGSFNQALILNDNYDQTRRYKSIFKLNTVIALIDWVEGSSWTDLHDCAYQQDSLIPFSSMTDLQKIPSFVTNVFYQETERLEEIKVRPEGPEGLEARRIQGAQRRDLVIEYLRNNNRIAAPILAPLAPPPPPAPPAPPAPPVHVLPPPPPPPAPALPRPRRHRAYSPISYLDSPRALDASVYASGNTSRQLFLYGCRCGNNTKNEFRNTENYGDYGDDTMNTGDNNMYLDPNMYNTPHIHKIDDTDDDENKEEEKKGDDKPDFSAIS